MSAQLKAGEKKRIELQGVDVKGIAFNASITASSTGATGVAAGVGIDWDKVSVQATLYQNKKETTLFSGQLLPLLMESSFLESEWNGVSSTTGTKKDHVMVAGATGVKNHRLMTGGIDFGGIINLRDDDKILLEVRVSSDAFASTVDTSLSHLDVDSIEGIGLQYSTPVIHLISIGNGEGNFRHQLGDNTTSVMFLNTDKSGVLKADSVVSAYRLYSDRFDINDDYFQLLNKRVSTFVSYEEANDRSQSFMIFSGEVDKCRLELDLQAANVNVSKNYVAYRTFNTGRAIVSKARRREEKHVAHRIKKIAKHK